MTLLSEAINALGQVLLPVAVGLLFEELTVGGLVRLILAPPPGARKRKERKNRGENQCSH
jgi:hypothetical protein